MIRREELGGKGGRWGEPLYTAYITRGDVEGR